MLRALILGGTGMIGGATARRLAAAGWRVEVAGRDPGRLPPDLAAAGVRFHQADRADAARLGEVLGDGADLLVDCVCYTAADARLLLPLAARASSAVLISSKAVYVDAAGRHANSDAAPDYGGPITESQATLPPGDMDHRSPEGYGPNKVAAELVALDSGLPISILRPARVHGVGARRPREWVFVKRVLDRRPAVLLSARGAGIVQPTAAANIAALIETVAHRPGARILNSADPDAPSVREIAKTIARQLGHSWNEVLLDDTAEPGLGRTPWDGPHPVILDTTASLKLGYKPVGDYAGTVAEEVDWLFDVHRSGDPRGVLPSPRDAYFARFFDYAAEDAYLAAR
ncbi:saccharopine dehydrogenase NADP-binding domain-containing protein [Actinospica sp. MGRD01-02]|uniref:Saccharopine dehydrogenase NADP-binding domain-containing protein n=1 Tax=Actinospica acidithermotolerans TaxID=2828514 RepID=A0A941ILF9_9ACTN|nr:NAD-dependent epimerase/dehydratase family protein [Actinospica acidithermotolerans]MBR7829962.1 saccharopine dehydrogenase NADP-binding domain-containing protein [Actinospica acidithermotolerans]